MAAHLELKIYFVRGVGFQILKFGTPLKTHLSAGPARTQPQKRSILRRESLLIGPIRVGTRRRARFAGAPLLGRAGKSGPARFGALPFAAAHELVHVVDSPILPAFVFCRFGLTRCSIGTTKPSSRALYLLLVGGGPHWHGCPAGRGGLGAGSARSDAGLSATSMHPRERR